MELQSLKSSNQNELTDEVCILNFCKLNDEAAFTCLVNRYAKSIRRIIYSVIRGPIEDIEDVEQEVLMALYKGLPKFSFKSSFSTYLYRLCRNKAIDFIRKRKRITSNSRGNMENIDAIDSNTPEKLYFNEAAKKNVLNTIFELEEKERSIIIMKDVENLSISEIADIFHKPVGTIKSRLHRARKKVAAKILKGDV